MDFLSGYNQQNQLNQQRALGELQQAHGAMGILSQIQAQQAQQAIKGVLSSNLPQEQKMEALVKLPGGIQIAGTLAQLQDHQVKAAESQRQQAFYSPENRAQYMTPGMPGSAAPPDELGGGPAMPAQPGQFDTRRFAEAGATQGIKGMEPLLNHLATRDQARAAMGQTAELRREQMAQQYELAQQRAEDQRASQQERLQARADMVRLAASLRAPPQPRQAQVVQGADGPMVLGDDGIARPVMDASGQRVKPRADEKPVTEFQGKNMLYGTRAAQAHNVLNALEDNVSLVGLAAKQGVSSVPLVGGALGAAGNTMLSANQQSVEQAQRNFVNAVLRQESGAVISDQEFNNARKQYFPQPGDSAQVKEQKRQNRMTAIEGFERLAGPAGTEVRNALNTAPLAAPDAPMRRAGDKSGEWTPSKEQRYQELLRKRNGS